MPQGEFLCRLRQTNLLNHRRGKRGGQGSVVPTVPPLGDFAIADGDEARATEGNSLFVAVIPKKSPLYVPATSQCRHARVSSPTDLRIRTERSGKAPKNMLRRWENCAIPQTCAPPAKCATASSAIERVHGTLLTGLPDSLKPFVYYFFRSWWFHGRFGLGTALRALVWRGVRLPIP